MFSYRTIKIFLPTLVLGVLALTCVEHHCLAGPPSAGKDQPQTIDPNILAPVVEVTASNPKPGFDPNILCSPPADLDPNTAFHDPSAIDPNAEPNLPEELLPIPLHADPNEFRPASWKSPLMYWQPKYHPQVTSSIFRIICYPYYPGGQAYPAADLAQMGALAPEDYPINSAAGSPTDPNRPAPERLSSPAAMIQLQSSLVKCCDLVHKWRSINESPALALEIIRSVELTRTTTSIYRINPRLAVEVKRVIGHIGRVNHNFDLTSRWAMRALTEGKVEKILFGRMEKQLADLEAQLVRLENLNDSISLALGIGKINRTSPPPDKIDFSCLIMPAAN